MKTIYGRKADESGKATQVEATIYAPNRIPESAPNLGECYICVISIPLIRAEDFFCCGIDERQALELSESFVDEMFNHSRIDRL